MNYTTPRVCHRPRGGQRTERGTVRVNGYSRPGGRHRTLVRSLKLFYPIGGV
jgi:hypothetical protein